MHRNPCTSCTLPLLVAPSFNFPVSPSLSASPGLLPPQVRRVVEGVVAAQVADWLELHPDAFAALLGKGLQAAKAAEAARKARDLVRRKNVLTRSTLPGKLADCTSEWGGG